MLESIHDQPADRDDKERSRERGRELTMGVNNRQRRAAKQRKRARDRGRSPGSASWANGANGANGSAPGFFEEDLLRDFRPSEHDRRELAELMVAAAVEKLIDRRSVTAADALESARSLLSPLQPVSPRIVGQAIAALLGRLGAEAARGGWAEADLQELVRRRVGEEHVGLLDAAARPAATGCTPETLASHMRVAAALTMVPLAAGETCTHGSQASRRPAMSQESAKKLAKVRALLAKAEATSFDEEADALSAKAQELISRHALERLLQEDPATTTTPEAPSVRRIWLDAPYLMAKATLVDAVAGANRCRCVVSEALGVCSVVGNPSDLESVELLSTSLLVQASRSMLRHGRHQDYRGVSRTRSFRQSFLTSFAIRIGHRLREVNQEAIRNTEPGTDLVPVLRNHERWVEEAVETMFPHVVQTETAASNGLGWAAGHAAADLALLDVHRRITPAASPT